MAAGGIPFPSQPGRLVWGVGGVEGGGDGGRGNGGANEETAKHGFQVPKKGEEGRIRKSRFCYF